MDGPHFVTSFTCGWTPGLFPLLGSREESRYEHARANACSNPAFDHFHTYPEVGLPDRMVVPSLIFGEIHLLLACIATYESARGTGAPREKPRASSSRCWRRGAGALERGEARPPTHFLQVVRAKADILISSHFQGEGERSFDGEATRYKDPPREKPHGWGGRELWGGGVVFAPFCTIQVLKLHPKCWVAALETHQAGQGEK